MCRGGLLYCVAGEWAGNRMSIDLGVKNDIWGVEEAGWVPSEVGDLP